MSELSCFEEEEEEEEEMVFICSSSLSYVVLKARKEL
jgi:hypothetical protein